MASYLAGSTCGILDSVSNSNRPTVLSPSVLPDWGGGGQNQAKAGTCTLLRTVP